MNDSFVRTKFGASAQPNVALEALVESLVRGECGEHDFVRDMAILRKSTPECDWNVLELLDQRCKRGQISSSQLRSVEAKIEQWEVDDKNYGVTVRLDSTVSLPVPTMIERLVAQVAKVPVEPPLAANPIQGGTPIERVIAGVQHGPDGRVLRNRYIIEKLLGRGGMGSVYKAIDQFRADLPEDSRHVAIKILHEKVSQRPEIFSDLRREFYCAQALSHPNIVNVYEVDHDDDVIFFTMEYLEGELLSGVIERMQPRPLARDHAWTIIRDVGAGLAHAHLHKVVHGDLKPQNVMITNLGEIRILDFGASSKSFRSYAASATVVKAHPPSVTLAYASCELLEGQGTDPRDDLYALACLAYELLAGEHPFRRRRATEARDVGMAPRRPLGLNLRQWKTLLHGLQWSREKRSISVQDWIAGLDIKPGLERLPAPQVLGTRHTPVWDLPTVRYASALAMLVAVLAVGVAINRKAENTPLPVSNVAVTAQPIVSPVPAKPLAALLPERAVTPPPTEVQTPEVVRTVESTVTSPVAKRVAPRAKANIFVRPAVLSKPMPKKALVAASAISTVSFAATIFRITGSGKFAEIRIIRSNAAAAQDSFVWWTEAGSAIPGVDFVLQPRMRQFFLKGSHSAKLFVKILPNLARKHSVEIILGLSEPSKGTKLGVFTHARIVIPAGRK